MRLDRRANRITVEGFSLDRAGLDGFGRHQIDQGIGPVILAQAFEPPIQPLSDPVKLVHVAVKSGRIVTKVRPIGVLPCPHDANIADKHANLERNNGAIMAFNPAKPGQSGSEDRCECGFFGGIGGLNRPFVKPQCRSRDRPQGRLVIGCPMAKRLPRQCGSAIGQTAFSGIRNQCLAGFGRCTRIVDAEHGHHSLACREGNRHFHRRRSGTTFGSLAIANLSSIASIIGCSRVRNDCDAFSMLSTNEAKATERSPCP